MRDLITEALGQLATLVIGLLLLAWWLGGPGLTAVAWGAGDRTYALGLLATWATVTALYFVASRLIRRALRARR
ncbi:hypothetical protein [Streptomyces muensis]|uniref:Uncharacterized protein n=1 Tax=Streptomyces muensis TaxID=1077944 RepID=A0A9X1Q9G8_STRM4|nr:hypothetical protein [Streptomyces muensis]MCF1600320.1 hypothetical protein [Streptomyces muensis]